MSTCSRQRPIERAVLDRLGDVRRGDALLAGEVGDRAGDLENARVGAGREPEALHGLLEQALALAVGLAVVAQITARHLGVREDAAALEALELAAAGRLDAGADHRRRLGGGLGGEFAEGDRGDLEVFYNGERSHSSLGYMSPAAFERMHEDSLAA
jgi:hypothetical protein